MQPGIAERGPQGSPTPDTLPSRSTVQQRFPVSIKGVVLTPSHDVVLLKNEREEWELPGGKLEPREDPTACVVRELEEELGLRVRAGPLLDSWLYEVHPGVEVLIVTYGCYAEPFTTVTLGSEHKAVGIFAPGVVSRLPMPDGYKRSIQQWVARVEAHDANS